MKIKAEMGRKRAPLWPHEYQVDKVVELPNTAFASFMIQPLDHYDFIERNRVEPHQGTGLNHCLLVLSDDRTDGALVQCGDDGRAMYAAYVAGARDIVQARLERVTDFITGQGAQRTASGSWYVYCEELEEKFGVTIQEGNGLDAMLKETLELRAEGGFNVLEGNVHLGHLEAALQRILQHGVQTIALLDGYAEFFIQLLTVDVPAPAGCALGALADDEVHHPVQSGLHHIPRPRHIGGVRGAAIDAALHQHAVRAALA